MTAASFTDRCAGNAKVSSAAEGDLEFDAATKDGSPGGLAVVKSIPFKIPQGA